MYDMQTRQQALHDLRAGASLRSVSRDRGINRSTLRGWLRQPVPHDRYTGCPLCSNAPAADPSDYLYLLGLYLGDGCISSAARTTSMRIACADAWPGLIQECKRALIAVSGRKVYLVKAQGCVSVTVLWKHWPCLFPQAGPGRKHERKILLADWQRELVAANPRPLIRGLLHSDGCRAMNTIHHDLPSGRRTYAYPRYFFSNVSDDIRGIYTDALDQLGIEWKQNRWNSISVAKREAVAALDEFVGPKA